MLLCFMTPDAVSPVAHIIVPFFIRPEIKKNRASQLEKSQYPAVYLFDFLKNALYALSATINRHKAR